MPIQPTAYPSVWKDEFHFHCTHAQKDSSAASSSIRIKPALPLAENFLSQEPEAHKELKPVEPAEDWEGANRPGRVLIVEDDEDNLFYAECAVEEFGYCWASTSLGNMVLPLALAYKPDIILLDIWLKHATGFEVIQQLQQHGQTLHIPTIAVTALSMPDSLKQISEAGFSSYLLKPYLLEDMGRMLAQYQPKTVRSARS